MGAADTYACVTLRRRRVTSVLTGQARSAMNGAMRRCIAPHCDLHLGSSASSTSKHPNMRYNLQLMFRDMRQCRSNINAHSCACRSYQYRRKSHSFCSANTRAAPGNTVRRRRFSSVLCAVHSPTFCTLVARSANACAVCEAWSDRHSDLSPGRGQPLARNPDEKARCADLQIREEKPNPLRIQLRCCV